jgi:phosphoribosyl 1,2-cyclic phosphate phosphodiesterase
MHGTQPVLAYRVGPFAYITDCSAIPDASWPLLEGVQVLVLDALRHRPHPTHFTVAQALETIERLRPRTAYLTHICHDLPHAATSARLPAGVQLAYDGLRVDIQEA